MSARYSTSPALRLRIAESTIARSLRTLYRLAVAAALLELLFRGHLLPVAASVAFLVVAGCCRRNPRSLTGAALCWSAGRWTLEAGTECRELTLRRTHCLPWVTYVEWREEDGGVERAWLFNDSGDLEQLRRLRVRLQLERGI